MFLYVSGVKTEDEALRAIDMGADAIEAMLNDGEAPLWTEACREWIVRLPFGVWRAGLFHKAPYYDVEEIVTFCQLDILHFTGPRDDLEHYSSWLLTENGEKEADAFLCSADSSLQTQDGQRLLLDATNVAINDLPSVLSARKFFGVAMPFDLLNEKAANLVKKL